MAYDVATRTKDRWPNREERVNDFGYVVIIRGMGIVRGLRSVRRTDSLNDIRDSDADADADAEADAEVDADDRVTAVLEDWAKVAEDTGETVDFLRDLFLSRDCDCKRDCFCLLFILCGRHPWFDFVKNVLQ